MYPSLPHRDQQTIWHPFTQMKMAPLAVPIVKGEGVYLYDESGKQYIDAISSWWTNLHGHCHPHIVNKIYEQLKKLEHVIFAGFTHEPAIELAEKLLQHLPKNQSKIFYSDNGSTAVEVALKMAFQYWHNQNNPKTKVIAFKEAYHGDTFGAMSVGGRSAFTTSFSPFLFDVIHIDVPIKGKEKVCLQQLKKAIHDNNAAAFIFEPLVLGAAGMIMYEADVLNELLKICKENNVIAIADEVMTGFGRTGKFLATDYIEEKPDIFCFSKGLTGGFMAMGITSCSEEIYNAFLSDDKLKTFFHGHSYTANPLACAAALGSLELMEASPPAPLQRRGESYDSWKGIKLISSLHESFINEIKNHPAIKNARQKGTILAIELKSSENTSYFNPLKDKLYKFYIDQGVILRPLGNVVYIMPPYCISSSDLIFIYSVIEHSLQ
jgi:adenosylmethionine-8-amino-7-oxononanoate aminotransferase